MSKKKLLSAPLALIVAVFTALVFGGITVSADPVQLVDSGTFGAQTSNLTWSLDVDGVMTISGTGEMADLYADAIGVDQRVDDVDHPEARRGFDTGAEVCADAHRADVAPLPLLGQVLKGLLMAPKGVEGFLLMQHEQVHVVPPDAPKGPLQRLGLHLDHRFTATDHIACTFLKKRNHISAFFDSSSERIPCIK